MKPGRYVGVTTSVTKKSWHGARDYLVVLFDLFESIDALGVGEVPVARGVAAFFNLASGPASRYARLIGLLFPEGGPQRSSDLIGKTLEVEVVTVERDRDEKPLPDENRYSKVSEVLARA